jgi:hypothetical protein
MLSQGVGIRPSRPAAGSLDQLRATIIIAVSGLALSLPEFARAQPDAELSTLIWNVMMMR